MHEIFSTMACYILLGLYFMQLFISIATICLIMPAFSMASHGRLYPLNVMQIGQPPYRGGGRRGGRPFRRGGRSFRGGSYYPPHHAASTPNSGSVPTAEGPGALQLQGKAPEALAQFPAIAQHSNPSWRSPCMAAWCELCRVDCNTLEILEQHKNGKRHKKNLQVHQELQNLNKLITGVQNEQMPISDFKPQVTHQPESVLQGSEDKQQPSQGTGADGSEKVQQTEVERSQVSAQPTEESEEMKGRMDRFQAPPGRGFKRKMRGVGGRGRGGGKRMRQYDEPPKPREMMIPLICELCNVKCESQVVFESHLAGKKHHSNLKRFHGYQAIIAGALQALIPSNNPNNAPPNFFIPQLHQQGASSSSSLGFPAQPMPPYMLQGQAPGFAPEPQPAPVSVSASETHGKEDTKTVGGSQAATTKSGNQNSVVTVEAANSQLTMSEALSGVSETSASEEAKDVIRHPPPGMAPSEDKVIG